jgi:protease YdgD
MKPAAVAVAALALAVLACSSAQPSSLAASPPSVDLAVPPRGVPDRGADPAVVLLDVAGQGWCSGALVAADVVLTARRCISILQGDLRCPAAGPQIAGARDLTTVRVLVGEDAATAVERARARSAVVPDGDVLCGADIALLALDATIDDVSPLVVHATGAAVGDHVRTVAYARGHRMVRDHVPVAASSSRELSLAEAPCEGEAGGPALDEATGEVVGVLSRGGPSCGAGAGYDVDTRADAFLPLVQRALAAGAAAHGAHQAKPKKGPVDLGASCVRASDCAAAACVDYGGSQYCSRLCGATDHCPSKYRCVATQEGPTACVMP